MAGSNSGGVTLKVTPDQLRSKADMVSREISAMTNAFDELARIVSRTSYYWEGEAGTRCRKLYEENKKEAELVLRRLREHPRDLLQMAQVYEDVERRVRETASALPENVIS